MAIESLDDWMASYSEADELSIEVLDLVSSLLEKADVDAKRRRSSGKTDNGCQLRRPLSAYAWTIRIFRSIDRIESDQLAPDGIAPESYSEDQLDELDRLTEKWVDDYERKAVKRKQPRTPDS